MEPVQPLETPTPTLDTDAVAVEAPIAPAPEVATPAPAAAIVSVEEGRAYPSLYDSTGTTFLAILLGIVIVGGIQLGVHRIYTKARNEQELLTRFVVVLVSLVTGAYLSDLLIAGPDTSLLSDDEHAMILGFIKDICLMTFSFYFGTKATAAPVSGSAE